MALIIYSGEVSVFSMCRFVGMFLLIFVEILSNFIHILIHLSLIFVCLLMCDENDNSCLSLIKLLSTLRTKVHFCCFYNPRSFYLLLSIDITSILISLQLKFIREIELSRCRFLKIYIYRETLL